MTFFVNQLKNTTLETGSIFNFTITAHLSTCTPYPKAASMVTMVAMVGNSVGNSAKKSVVKFWSTS